MLIVLAYIHSRVFRALPLPPYLFVPLSLPHPRVSSENMTVRKPYHRAAGPGRAGNRNGTRTREKCASAEANEGDEEPAAPQVQARRLLNLFQFPAARWNDRVGRLSGGEKRRLQLLKVLATNPNFLVLDEVRGEGTGERGVDKKDRTGFGVGGFECVGCFGRQLL